MYTCNFRRNYTARQILKEVSTLSIVSLIGALTWPVSVRAQSVSDSDFFSVDSVCDLPLNTPATFSVTVSIDMKTPARSLMFPLSFAGIPGLEVDLTVGADDTLGVTFHDLGDHSVWNVKNSLVNNAQQTIVITLISFADPLPPSSGPVFDIHFNLPARATPSKTNIDSIRILIPPNLQNFLSFTDDNEPVNEYIPQFSPGAVGVDTDSDFDGVVDICDVCPLDPLNDADGDGHCADVDNCPTTANPSQSNSDGDALGNACDNCPNTTNPIQEDFDQDGIGDLCDLCTDSDGDGSGDPGFPLNTCPTDLCPDDPDPLQLDGDGDGFGDVCDNCPGQFNPAQDDGLDNDGVGDVCDNCPAHANPLQEDDDLDHRGNACDVDAILEYRVHSGRRGPRSYAASQADTLLPLRLVVLDPNGDSIGLASDGTIFNTIQDSSVCDTTQDLNSDGTLDIRVAIPDAVVGNYVAKLIPEPGADPSASFTLSTRINGNQAFIPEGYADQSVSGIGTVVPAEVVYTTTPTFAGDVNADGIWTSADIISMVNYIFKSGIPPVVDGHADVNCDGKDTSSDIILMVNFTFKGGVPPCSQTAGG